MSSSREGVLLRAGAAQQAVPYRGSRADQIPVQPPGPAVERRSTIRRAADLPVVGGGASFRLGDVYAEELERLRQHAHAEGCAAGHAEGLTAAAAVVAETERAAAERLADVQARWERRLGSANAAPGPAGGRPAGGGGWCRRRPRSARRPPGSTRRRCRSPTTSATRS